MTEQELRKLNRVELLELLLEESRENERLRAELAEAERRLADRSIAASKAGSIAQAALQLNGVFEAAQRAAEQYVENVRRAADRRYGPGAQAQPQPQPAPAPHAASAYPQRPAQAPAPQAQPQPAAPRPYAAPAQPQPAPSARAAQPAPARPQAQPASRNQLVTDTRANRQVPASVASASPAPSPAEDPYEAAARRFVAGEGRA